MLNISFPIIFCRQRKDSSSEHDVGIDYSDIYKYELCSFDIGAA